MSKSKISHTQNNLTEDKVLLVDFRSITDRTCNVRTPVTNILGKKANAGTFMDTIILLSINLAS
jgi:hypothetical protein